MASRVFASGMVICVCTVGHWANGRAGAVPCGRGEDSCDAIGYSEFNICFKLVQNYFENSFQVILCDYIMSEEEKAQSYYRLHPLRNTIHNMNSSFFRM